MSAVCFQGGRRRWIAAAWVVLATGCTAGARRPSDLGPGGGARPDAAARGATDGGPEAGSPAPAADLDANGEETGDAALEGASDPTEDEAGAGAGAIGDGGDAAPLGPPQCDPAHAWAIVGRIASVPAAGFGRFGGVALDERSIAWTSTTGDVMVADRPSRAAAFEAAAVVSTGGVALADDRVALSPTGTTLVAVVAERSRFVAFGRSGVGSAWTASDALSFANVDAMATVDSQARFSEPVLGADDTSFFYLFATGGGAPALFESRWDAQQHAWSAGVALAGAQLASTTAARRRATGASSDGRTLFFFDEAAGAERGAWRDAPAAAFTTFVEGPAALPEAAPNARCDTIYFQGADAAGAGVFVAR